MGQTLSEPVVDKHTAGSEDERLAWGVSEMQGWRLTMEDSHAHILSLGDETPSTSESGGRPGKTSFFAVYDGHGGSSVARFAGDTLHARLAAGPLFQKKDFEASLKRAFLETDEDLRSNADFKGDPSGCTAVAAIITEDYKIICANSGDSRSVMSVGGEAKPLSFDHKPTNPGENARIVAAGGFVEFGRVNGNLALSRALGDFEFKQNASLDAEHQIVTADPDITVHEPTSDDEFVVIACDGIWDVLSSQQVIDFVRLSISHLTPLTEICEALMDRCLAPDSDWGGVGCDNMTAMVIALKKDRTTEEWYQWVKTRVENGEGNWKTPNELPDPFAQGSRAGLAGPQTGAGGMAVNLSAGGGGKAAKDDGGKEGGKMSKASLTSFQAILKAQGIEIDPSKFQGLEADESDEDEEDEDEEHVELVVDAKEVKA